MRKLFSIALAVLILTLYLSIANTNAEEHSESISFFESTENLQKFKSYGINQAISGHFEGGDEFFNYHGTFYLKINADVYNQKPYEPDNDMLIRGNLQITAEGEDKPFDTLWVNVRGKAIQITNEGLYVRLDTLDLTASGVPENDKDNYLEFKTGLDQDLRPIKGNWFYVPEEVYISEATADLPEGLDQETIRENLKEKGIKETYRELITDLLTEIAINETIEKEAQKKAQKIIDDFFATNFFTSRLVTRGAQKGYMSHILSKQRVVDFLLRTAQTLEEPISEFDPAELNNFLRKFYLSIMTHENTEHRIYDGFRVRLLLNDIFLLDRFGITFSYKVNEINEGGPIRRPDQFSHYETLELPFTP